VNDPGRIRHLSRSACLLAVIALLVGVTPAAAGDYRSGDSVTVQADEQVDDDLYVGAGTVTIEGTVNGDASVAGGTVTITGDVTGSVNAGGGTVEIRGTVGGAVRVSGGTVRVTGSIGRDLVLVGGTATVDSGAVIAGDIVGGLGTLSMDGEVGGDLLVGAGTIEITGTVNGSLDVAVDDLVIAPDAVIGGDVLYTSDDEAEISDGAQIGGEVTRRDPPAATDRAFAGDNPLVAYVGALLGLLVLGWGLMLIRPRLVVGSGEELRNRPLLACGAGLATWIGQFLLVILLFALAVATGILAGSLGGAFVVAAVVVILMIIVLTMLSGVPLAMAIGDLVLRARSTSPYVAYLVGAAILAAIFVLVGLLGGPLGGILALVAWILGLGAYTLWVLRTRSEPVTVVTAPASPPTSAAPPPPTAAG